MKSLNVTINNLMAFSDGIAHGTKVTFKVLQSGKVLIEETLSGKVTSPYVKKYEVVGSDADVVVEHDRPDLAHLSITAAFV